MVDAAIIERIRKLLALTTSSNPHESARALAKAQKLLAEYNLSLATVQASGASEQKSAYTRTFYALSTNERWKRSLMNIIAKQNFCEAITVQGHQISLVGEDVNLQAVLVLYEYILPQLVHLAECGYQASTRRVHVRTWKNNFFWGALAVIKTRLIEERSAFEALSNQCRALIVVKDRDVREAVKRFHPRIVTHTGRFRSAPDGYAAGVAAGQQVTIRRSIDE